MHLTTYKYHLNSSKLFQTQTNFPLSISSIAIKVVCKKMSSSCVLSVLVMILCLINFCSGSRKLFSLYEDPPMALTYHNGELLEGDLHVSILWYGKFTPAQKSIIVDFLLSLNPSERNVAAKTPQVSHWWQTIETYMKLANKKQARVLLSDQISDEKCSIGKILSKNQIYELAHQRANLNPGGLTLVLTADDVAVEGFCRICGYHDGDRRKKNVYIWVGNSVTQCPGQCAWPFHQPMYGPQTKPLGAPNGDVGVDGMVVNIASLLAGAVTNPYGHGYYQDSAGAPSSEAASACAGMYGKGAYPGYAGKLLEDSASGSSYNALGANGRKYLLPALFDPNTSRCSTIV